MSDDDVHPHEMSDELDDFLDDLRRAAAEAPAPVVGDALATLFREGAAPVAAPATTVRRRWTARAVVAGAVAGIAFGGLGVAGALPRPVQQRVADVVDHVGVHLPDARPATTTTTVTVPPTTTSTTALPPTTGAPVPTTVDDHGQHRGQGGDGNGNGSSGQGNGSDDGSSGKGNSGNGNGNGGSGDDGSGKGKGNGKGKQDDDAASGGDEVQPVEVSGRNPGHGGDVHVDEGPDRSGSEDDEGRTE
jgi:hypothetical protein